MPLSSVPTDTKKKMKKTLTFRSLPLLFIDYDNRSSSILFSSLGIRCIVFFERNKKNQRFNTTMTMLHSVSTASNRYWFYLSVCPLFLTLSGIFFLLSILISLTRDLIIIEVALMVPSSSLSFCEYTSPSSAKWTFCVLVWK